MKRGISHLHAIVVLAALGLMAVSGCEQKEGELQAPPIDSHDAMSGVIEVEAGEVAGKLLGVETYRIYVDLTNAVMEVELLDSAGEARGKLNMVLGQEVELSRLELTTPDGGVATVTPNQIDHYDGQTTVVRRFESKGAIFRTISRVDASGEVVEIAYDSGGPADQLGEGGIVVARDGVAEQQSAIQQWLDDNSASLQENAAMNALYVVMVEPSWLMGVADLVGSLEGGTLEGGDGHEGNLGTSKQAIHKSPLCSALIAVLAVGGILTAVCVSCGVSVAALPASAGWSAIAAIPACVWCAAGVGLGIVDLFACFISYYRAKNANDCVSECNPWDDASVAADEHTCVCTCNAAKCDTACKNAHGQNYQGNNCLNNECKCSQIPGATASSSSVSSSGTGGSSTVSSTGAGASGGYGGSSSYSSASTGSTGGYGGSSSYSSSGAGASGGYGGYGGSSSYSSSGVGAYGGN